ncbi:hypothetical protein BsWGS_18177 [Bradybaena similaris]
MASGGFRPNKSGKSQPKRRGNWKHSASSDRDDAQSLNSFLSDMRINNWDLSDLRPSNLGGDSKRCKKSKGNPEREKEQSLSLDSPPQDKKQYRTSFPRAGGLKSQQEALENLKHHMTFSDVEDQVSTDGERNNERQMSQGRWRYQNSSFNMTGSDDDFRRTRDRHVNRNNNMDYSSREQGPDSNEIMAHLMQIRDFTKQARSMLESMEKLGDRKKAEDIEKVRRLIRNLQEQEQGYRGLLQNTLTHHEEDGDEAAGCDDDTTMKMEVKYDSDDDTSVDLEVQTEESDTTENSQDLRPRIESKLGIGSSDGENVEEDPYRLPVRGAVENTSEKANSHKLADLENSLIQGHLGLFGAPAGEGEGGGQGDFDGEAASARHQELMFILREKEQQLQALMSRQEELNLKRRETEKKLLEAQTRDNKARAALVAVTTDRQILEQKIASQQARAEETELGLAAWEMNGNDDETVGEERQLKSNIVGYPESDDEDNSKVCEVESLPSELMELKRQLNYLRNEFSQASEAPKNVESEEGRQQLQNKLQKLQNKKSRMDLLLQELRMLHSQPPDHVRNNETNPQTASDQPSSAAASNIPTSRPQKQPSRPALPNLSANSGQATKHPARLSEIKAAAANEVDNASALFAQCAREGAFEQEVESVDPGMVHDMHEKLRRLKEVRGQLDQLRSLVQYYQGQKDEAEEADIDVGSLTLLPGSSDNALLRQTSSEVKGSQSSLQQQSLKQQQQQQQVQELARLKSQQHRRQGKESEVTTAASLLNTIQLPNLAGTDQGGELSDEDNASVSQTDSQWSHLGPWDVDPEIQEKVRKLRAAKEKLRQLQDLVAFVQQSPDTVNTAPENIADLTSSVESKAVSHATQTENLSVSVSEGEIPPEAPRIQSRDGLNGSENSRAELLMLRKERFMLMEIQNQLKNIHHQTPNTQGREIQAGTNTDMGKAGMEQVPSGTVVTFASNDELYSKMRRQRMLREELRSKKKELEAIMKKDRNKRQYSRNQDNQSDTISLNTDAFGAPASIDATMATWGGSTVDNLENITEDEGRQERSDRGNGNEEDEDDGYPSDGIVQVEEEEEENESDNGTYTIERDARQRKTIRNDGNIGARPKTSRGRQTYVQPTYRDKNKQKSSRQQTRTRNFQNPRVARSRDEQDHTLSLEQRESSEFFQQPKVEWYRSIEDKLSSLGNAVDMLLRKSDNEGRQLSMSLNQEAALPGGNMLSPVQEQMLQLQNQSMMLSFGHLVQSLTHQQADIQQLQQHMQALQLQVHEVLHECSFHSASGVTHPQLLHPPLLNPGLNSNSYNLQTSAVGTHSLTLNRQQASPLAQSNLGGSVPFGVFSELSTNSPGLRSLQPSGLGLSVSNLSLGLDRRAAGGNAALGTSLSVNTGSNLSLPQHDPGIGFTSLGQSALNSQRSQQHQASQAASSVGAMAKDFRQFVTALQSTPQAADSRYESFSNFPESSSHQYQRNMVGRFPFVSSSQDGDNEETSADKSKPRVTLGSSDSRNINRKFDLNVKKSDSDPTSGVKLPSDMDNFQVVGRNNGHPYREKATTADLRSLANSAAADSASNVVAAGLGSGSSSSYAQFIRDKHSRLRREQKHAKASTATESNSLFDTLRDTIYAEVASVISQNEGNPHFLLELFRDMRQIDSDLLRQRTLYSLRELLRSNLRADLTTSEPSSFWGNGVLNTVGKVTSELTPSEGGISEDDDDVKVARFQEEVSTAERNWLDRLSQISTFQSFPFDYSDTANNPRSLSISTNGGEESPFFQDTLGETVIEFNSLKRDGDNEQLASQGDVSRRSNQHRFVDGQVGQNLGHGLFQVSEKFVKDPKNTRPREKRKSRRAEGAESGLRSVGSQSSDVASSSAMDQGSESSVSDMPYARIDMKQLDRQIKDIMMKTIPVVKEHMGDICSSRLLSYIKRLVLSLTGQLSNQEFAGFFQHQLGSIIKDTLQKYEGRKMRDCGEDLLVEISDVLFNELAFFRLMQDLDDPNVARKLQSTEWQAGISRDENSSEYAASTSASEGFDEDNNNFEDKNNEDGGTDKTLEEATDRQGEPKAELEQEEFMVNNEMVSKQGTRDADEKDDDETEQLYTIELAPSETKPFTRIGSDEDDDEEDEECSMDDPSETAVSRDSLLEISGQPAAIIPLSTRPETEGAQGDEPEKQDLEKPVSPKKTGQATAIKPHGEGDGAEVAPTNNNTTPAVADSLQVTMNGTVSEENNNDSDEELTVDDLPETLTVPPTPSPSVISNNNNNTVEH